MSFVFEWDPAKAESNRRKHKISFAEASTAFGDPLSVTIPDPGHSTTEDRFLLLARSATGRVVVVAYTERGVRTRIISARPATRRERREYEEGEG